MLHTRPARRFVVIVVLMAASSGAGCQKSSSPTSSPAPPAPASPPRAPEPPRLAGRVDVAVTEEGFVPNKIAAKAGQPLTLAITRKTDKTCATEIVFAGADGTLGEKTALPLGKTVEVAYVPQRSGSVKFGCAMGMMVGGVLEVAP